MSLTVYEHGKPLKFPANEPFKLPDIVVVDGVLVKPSWIEITTLEERENIRCFILGQSERLDL